MSKAAEKEGNEAGGRLIVRVKQPMQARLSRLAEQEGLTVSEIVRGAVVRWISEVEGRETATGRG